MIPLASGRYGSRTHVPLNYFIRAKTREYFHRPRGNIQFKTISLLSKTLSRLLWVANPLKI